MKKFLKNLKWMVLVISLLIAGFYGYKQYQEYKAQKLAEETVIKVACVGDSLTFRRSFTEEFYRYPTYLAELLGDKYKVINYGMGGTCVQEDLSYPYISTRAYRASVEAEADIIVIMLGTNDVWGDGWRDDVTFYQYYENFVKSYISDENKPEIYLCTLPYIYADEDANNSIGYKISTVIRQVAAENGYQLIDIQQVSIEHPEWYTEDGIHFNECGAIGVADVVYEKIYNKRVEK